MLKIRRPLGRLIFNMGIAIPGKTVFLIETTPSWLLYHPLLGISLLIRLQRHPSFKFVVCSEEFLFEFLFCLGESYGWWIPSVPSDMTYDPHLFHCDLKPEMVLYHNIRQTCTIIVKLMYLFWYRYMYITNIPWNPSHGMMVSCEECWINIEAWFAAESWSKHSHVECALIDLTMLVITSTVYVFWKAVLWVLTAGLS